MNTDKLEINWQNFAGVRLRRKFAFIIRWNCFQCGCVLVSHSWHRPSSQI